MTTPPVTTQAASLSITGIRFTGAKAPGSVAVAAKAFRGKRATQQTLTELAGALSAGYERTDVALYTVAIPDQDFAGGVVSVHLTEGTIGKVVVAANPQAHSLLRRRLARLAEKPLRRSAFERQITLAQAIPGLTVKTDFADPDATGTLVLTATPKQRGHRLTAGFTSRGVDLGALGSSISAWQPMASPSTATSSASRPARRATCAASVIYRAAMPCRWARKG